MAEFDLDPDLTRRMENMSEMMSRLGLDPVTATRRCGGAVFGAAVRVCEACPATDVCHDWLARAAASLYKTPAFCPNGDRFAQLLAEERALPRPKDASTRRG
jgi:hypothetical protein